MTTPRRGFTVIEMTIAVALGSLIVYVAFAGFRVASQTSTLANRLSLQNAILRSAVTAANEELDTWETFDSRTDTANQILRGATFPFSKDLVFTGSTALDFNPAHPRLWWTGHMWSSNRLSDGTNYQRRFGDYSLFGRQGLAAYEPISTYNTPIPQHFPPRPPPVLNLVDDRLWRHTIVPYLTNGLGYYAAFDYLPANFVYGFYDSAGDMPVEFGASGVGPGRFRNSWHGGNKPTVKVESGHDNGYIMTSATPASSGMPNTHPNSHRASYNDNGGTWTDTLYPDRFDAFPNMQFANDLPSMWPSVRMKVKATYQWMDFRHQVRIEQTDPATGATTSMVLHGMTTTLRGARRQRDLDKHPRDEYDP